MDRRINVLHINCNYMTTKLHQIMIRHLNKKGINSVVFSPISFTTKINIKPDDNVIVSRCFNKYDRFSYYYKQKKIYKSLMNEFHDFNKFDIIHSYTLFTDGNIAYKLSKKYRIPYVVAVRDTDVNAFLKYRFYLRSKGLKILLGAKKIFFLSNSYRKQVINKYIPQKYREELILKSEIIPNGIDDFWLENKKNISFKRKKIDKIKLLFVGQIIKRKNIILILKTVKRLKNEGWDISLDIVGKINDIKLYNKLLKNNDFHYLGEKSKNELIDCYRNHDIFIMPSKTETFGLVYAEAMSQGLPVIYTKNQGFDNQFENGLVGYSVNISNENDCVESIKKIIERYDSISNNCINNVNKFDWSDICSKYSSIYNCILEEKYEKK